MLSEVIKTDDTLIVKVTPAVTFVPGTALVRNSPLGVHACQAVGSELHITLRGSSHWRNEKKAVCREEDINSFSIKAQYSTSAFPIIGVMEIMLSPLQSPNASNLVTFEKQAKLVLKGQLFNASVVVQVQATQVTAAGATVPDTTPYSATAEFMPAAEQVAVKST